MPGAEAWQDFMDQAAVAGGRIPQGLLTDEKIVEKLPVLFRTIRGPGTGKGNWGAIARGGLARIQVSLERPLREPRTRRQFSLLLFENADLFDAFVKMPNQGGYSFPYSYKPARTAKTHVANENFNPDFFIRVRSKHDILVVEVKSEGDDSNRNQAKCRDGLKHFETLNAKLAEQGEPWRYHFYFLSPEDYASFFGRVRSGN